MNARGSFSSQAEVPVADSWTHSVTADLERSRRTAWIVASIAAAIALLLAIALAFLLPLKTTVPYTILVDRQTGHVETLSPSGTQPIAPDAALTRAFLVQYTTAREGFDRADLGEDYRRVALFSAGEVRQRYIAAMRSTSTDNPLVRYPPGTSVSVVPRSVSTLGPNRSLVRFTTELRNRQGALELVEHWAAVVDWRYSNAAMSAEDRYHNPLGFQVTRYTKDPETLPETFPPAVRVPATRLVPRSVPQPSIAR